MKSKNRTDIVKVIIQPENKTIQAQSGETLKDALDREGRYFIQTCGGKGKCGFCRVQFKSEAPQLLPREAELLGKNSKYRLACLHKVHTDIVIALPPIQEWLGDKTLTGFKAAGGGTGFGVAGDLGTTTIALYLVNLENGGIVGQVSFLNPQVPHGADVMTRLELAKDDEQRKRLNELAQKGLAEGMKKLFSEAGVNKTEVRRILLAGNTAMTHLFLGWGGEGLERAPFKSPLEGRGCIPFTPESVGMDWESACELAPVLSGFIGGDTTAAIIASKLDVKSGLRLLVDFGTNGEIVLAKNGAIRGCSAAAGPAFEGVGMKSGMAALKGAIEAFDPEGKPSVIGGGKPLGICGSGYISGIAYLLNAGILAPSGLLKKDEQGERSWSPPSQDSEFLSITQDDIRKFQLAKGAVSAGIDILLSETSVGWEQLDEVIITGSFGNRIDPEEAIRAGLLPPVAPEKITYIDNAAGRGAALCVSGTKYRQRALNLQQNMKFVNLGGHPRFQDVFVEMMKFPEKLQ